MEQKKYNSYKIHADEKTILPSAYKMAVRTRQILQDKVFFFFFFFFFFSLTGTITP
jgi:hypothetical protein